MRTITVQINAELDAHGPDMLAALLLALPVARNAGIWFDKSQGQTANTGTVVNRRNADTWAVSYRHGTGSPDLRHYASPRYAARAVIDGHHNEGGQP